MARGFVKYLASQELADSIAKAKSEMASRSNASNASTTSTAPHEVTPEEREQQRKACEALKNFNLGKAMSDATKQVFSEAVHEAVQEKKAEEKKDEEKKLLKGYQVTIFNKYVKQENYDINYQFYVNECIKIIQSVENKQLQLF